MRKELIPIPIEKDLFVAELNRLFGDGTLMDRPVVIGKACYGQLGGDLRVRAEFVSLNVYEQYNALRLTILNRTDGKVDQLTLPFSAVWGRKPVNNRNFTEGIIPYIWVDRGKPEWYVYKPTKQDMDRLRESCKSYLDVFREPVVPISKRTAKKAKSTRNGPAR